MRNFNKISNIIRHKSRCYFSFLYFQGLISCIFMPIMLFVPDISFFSFLMRSSQLNVTIQINHLVGLVDEIVATILT